MYDNLIALRVTRVSGIYKDYHVSLQFQFEECVFYLFRSASVLKSHIISLPSYPHAKHILSVTHRTIGFSPDSINFITSFVFRYASPGTGWRTVIKLM